MLNAIASLTTLGLLLGLLLAVAARFLRVAADPLVGELESLMPGSQCGQCGFPGCAPAAEALVAGEAPVTLCPPGGRALAGQLATRLGVTVDLSGVADKPPSIAVIDEQRCIGCTRCLKVCPTDAIVGASKQIHAVIRDACTGCEQCLDTCPTDCVVMHEIQPTLQSWHWPLPVLAA